MDVTSLRVKANQENVDLGPPPANPREHEMWREERHGAVLRPAALADHDAEDLRRAASGEWVSTGARRKLGSICRNEPQKRTHVRCREGD
jgi:hypothetical protein